MRELTKSNAIDGGNSRLNSARRRAALSSSAWLVFSAVSPPFWTHRICPVSPSPLRCFRFWQWSSSPSHGCCPSGFMRNGKSETIKAHRPSKWTADVFLGEQILQRSLSLPRNPKSRFTVVTSVLHYISPVLVLLKKAGQAISICF